MPFLFLLTASIVITTTTITTTGLKRIDLQTKRIIAQMITSGISVSDISRNIGVSRKAVKQIVANYRAYGMLEKKRGNVVIKHMKNVFANVFSVSFFTITITQNLEFRKVCKA